MRPIAVRNALQEALIQQHQTKSLYTYRALMLATAIFVAFFSALAQAPPVPGDSQPTILYGVAYYNEYMPADLQPARVDKDIALMKAAEIGRAHV